MAPPTAFERKKEIKHQLAENDVLCGRGPGLCNYSGNLRFREFVEERKSRYVAAQKRKEKSEIAKEVLDLVHTSGGRFVKQKEDATDYSDEWYTVDEPVAIEKCKQALREHATKNNAPTIAKTRGVKRNEASANKTSFPYSLLYSTSDASTSVMESSPEAPISNEGGTEIRARECRRIGKRLMHGVGESSLMDSDWSNVGGTILADGVASAAAMAPPSVALPMPSPPTLPCHSRPPTLPVTNASASLPLTTASSVPSIIDPRLLLFQNAPFAVNQQSVITQAMLLNQVLQSLLENSSLNSDASVIPESTFNTNQEILQALMDSANVAAAASHQQFVANNSMYSLVRNFALMQSNEQQAVESQCNAVQPTGQLDDAMNIDEEDDRKVAAATGTATASEQRRLSDTSIDDELSAFLLSSLAISDRPVVTEEQEALELTMMSDSEKAELLSDMFGRMVEEIDGPSEKRPRLDLDRGFVQFLVNQMRIEIENIPEFKRCALMKAQMSMKCSRDEFSDARLEKFLRCEGMNVKVRRCSRIW